MSEQGAVPPEEQEPVELPTPGEQAEPRRGMRWVSAIVVIAILVVFAVATAVFLKSLSRRGGAEDSGPPSYQAPPSGGR